MRSIVRVLLLIWISGSVLGAVAQNTTRSGFAIVTVVSGNIAGLIASETLENATQTGVEQAIVPPSPLITSASLLVPLGPVDENTTAITITNPSLGTGSVNLILTDALGNIVLNAIVPLGPHGQFSKFLNELFKVQPATFSSPLLLTISSEIPVAILALNFQAGDFVPIPLTSLASPTPVPVQQTAATVLIPGVFPGFGLGLPPPAPIIPSASPGFGLGLPPTTLVQTPTTAPVTVTTVPVAVVPTIGGGSSLVFAQVVTGGGWSTEIAIGNTSTSNQIIRIDFFGANGLNAGSLTNVLIPSRGVFFLSPAQVQPLL